MTSEEWKAVPGFEGQYEVSNIGRVRSTPRTDCNGRELKGYVLSQVARKDGYLKVHLRCGSRKINFTARVHRLVADAFIPNADQRPYVNHIDCNPANNHKDNLEWCTQQENLNYARSIGRMPDNYWKGKRSPTAKLSDADAEELRRLYSAGRETHRSLSERFGISKRSVGRIISGEYYPPLPNPPSESPNG